MGKELARGEIVLVGLWWLELREVFGLELSRGIGWDAWLGVVSLFNHHFMPRMQGGGGHHIGPFCARFPPPPLQPPTPFFFLCGAGVLLP